MKFEHLIEINDPLNPLIDPMTREQLWRGLVLHAEQPKLFMPHLDECTIVERSPGELNRKRRFGKLIVEVLDGLREANSDEGNAVVEARVRNKVMALTSRFPIYEN